MIIEDENNEVHVYKWVQTGSVHYLLNWEFGLGGWSVVKVTGGGENSTLVGMSWIGIVHVNE